VWAGVGMGERLGTIESLMREGIMPIPTDRGVACFMCLLKHRLPSVRMVVASRFGATPTLHMPTPDLPLLRFLEQTRIYYPGIELICDVEISTATDLYLEDHKFRGERLLPAVVGLEAMAQAAMAVTGQTHRPTFEQVQLERPIVVPERTPLKIRLAALVSESGAVDVALRSEETAFQVDHFRATCRFTSRSLTALERLSVLPRPAEPTTKIHLEPARDLYGSILFHQGNFQRLRSYSHLRATECVAEIRPYTGGSLFAHYLPAELMLGDFVARDAVIHAIQACIPHARLLPIAVEEIIFASDSLHTGQAHFVYARERVRYGDIFTYDVEVRTDHGDLEEQWRGLQLQQVEAFPPPESWNEALLGPYMERKINEFLPGASIQLIIRRDADVDRQASSDLAFRNLLGASASIQRRPDGKPALMERLAPSLSASHHAQFTLVIASPRQVGCDIEAIVKRPATVWQDLLGPDRSQLASFLTSQTGEDLDTASTRLWAASECLKKAGAMMNVPLRFGAKKADGWILLKAGAFLVATYITALLEGEDRLVLAICSGTESSSELERALRR
jgi:enediyne polyketide synthase